MKRTKQLLGAVSSVALIALSVSPAYAAGTTAGTSITNTVNVDYQVGGFDQTTETDTDTITVDRKIDLTVAETGFIGRTEVSPNETRAVIEFDVANLSNDTVDLALTAVNAAGNDFTLTNIIIFVDADSDGEYDVGEEVTFLDEVLADGVTQVLVAADIPIGAAAGETADIVLTAQAHAAGGAGLGAIYSPATTSGDGDANTEDGTVNAANVDTVLADGTGDTDASNDGAFSDTDGYVVVAADVTVSKQSRIIDDGVGGTFPNAKAIPGAIVEYCIIVSNGSGAATATGVTVSDVLPVDLEIADAFGVFINGTVASGYCAADGVDNANSNFTDNALGTPDEVDGTLNDLAAGATSTLYFRATIN